MPKLNTDNVEIQEDPQPVADQADDAADLPQPGADTPQEGGEDAADDAGSEGEGADEAAGAADEVTVTLGDEPAEEEDQRAPSWVRDLRESNREKGRQLRERDAEIARLKGSASAPPALGAKPSLEGCEFDAERYERELEGWYSRKRDADEQAAKRQQAEDASRAAWQKTLDGYNKGKAALKVRDFDEAEAVVQDLLDVAQQGIIVAGANEPATLIYALGKNPKKAAELAAIKDPVKFAFAIAGVQSQMKIQPRKSAPPPERVVRSSVAGAAAVDNQLEKLRADAAKTGDLSKVLSYKNQQRDKARARA